MKHRYFFLLFIVSLIFSAATQSAYATSIATVHISRVSGSNPLCSNSPVTFAATPTNGGTIPTYEWYVNGTQIAGAVSDTFTATSLPAGAPYIYCIITSNLSGVSGSPATSDTITMTVRATPTASDSGSTVICAGSSTFITINATGTGPFHGTLSNGASFSGNTSPIRLSVSPAIDSTYTIVSLSDAHCTAESTDLTDSVVISVTPRPTGRVSDTSSICIGQSAPIQFDFTNGSQWEFAYSHGSIIDTITTISPSLAFYFTPTITTSYRITYVKANGCTSRIADISGTGQIVINPLPVATIDAFNNHNQCWRNNSYSFGGSHSNVSGGNIVNWSWTFGHLHPDTASGSSPTVQFLDSGLNQTVTLWVTSNKGCMDSATTTISVKPMPNATFSTSDTSICKGSIVSVIAIEDSSSTFRWHWGEGTDSNCHCNPAAHIYSTINDKNLKLTVTNTLGCVDTSSVNIHVHALPTVAFHINDSAQCQKGNGFLLDDQSRMPATQQYGDSIVLYIWSYGDTSGLISGGIHAAYSYPANVSATYTITERAVTDFGCTDSASKRVIIFQTPSAQISASTPGDTLCAGTAYILTAISDGGRPTYRWSTNDSTSSIARTAINLTNTSQQIAYTVTVTDTASHHCTNTATRIITTYPLPALPMINSGVQASACNGSTLHFDVTNIESNASYVWYTNPAMPISGQANAHCDITFNNTANTILTLVATNSPWGCSASTTETVNYLNATAPSVNIVELPDATDSTLVALVMPDSNITYQWGLNAGGIPQYIAGATTQDLLLDTGNAAINYWVIVTDTLTHCTTKKYFISPVTTTSINDLSEAEIQVMLYPNPSTEKFNLNIATEKAQVLTLKVVDMIDNIISSQKLEADKNKTWQINAASWASGSYLLHISSAAGHGKTIKLIKE